MKLIKIAHDHYIIVDESKQPVEGYYYDNFIKDIRNTRGAEYGQTDHCWQITHSTQPLDERGYWGKVMPLTLTISEIKELIGEVDVGKKAEQEYREYPNNPKEHPDWQYSRDTNCHKKRKAFIKGYNQALEDNKEKKWTDEDVIRIVEKSRETGLTAEYLMMTFQPKTEWEVEFVNGKLTLKK